MQTLFTSNATVVWSILLPLSGAILAFLLPRRAGFFGLTSAFCILIAVIRLCKLLMAEGPLRYAVGGWGAPLGIEFYVDGLSILMLLMTAVVGAVVSVYGIFYFGREHQSPVGFWPLWLFLWAALNSLFLSADVFNLYVTLELLGLASVSLVALAGGADALVAAMRYLLASLMASLAYLFGVALLYHAYGSVDILTLGSLVTPIPAALAALGLMVASLLLKSALFPLHFWLPQAHASAPTPVSALLSALVVKASFYLLLRLWLDVFASIASDLGLWLGILGAGAILWGSFQALRQIHLKLLIAYSTVAQLGYLFLPFPLAAGAAAVTAWNGAIYFIISHALAKAAMFLAAGNILKSGGHDRIADLDQIVQRLPLSMAAFALAGVSIMGLPPSGGFVAKWLLLNAALKSGQWWWALIILAGGLLAAAYIFRVVWHFFTQSDGTHETQDIPRTMEWAALGLAIGAVALGLIPLQPLTLLEVGDPFGFPVREGAL